MSIRALLTAPLALATAFAQPQAAPTSAPTSRRAAPYAQISRIFSTLHERGEFNGVVLLAEGNRVRFLKPYGYADYGAKRPLTVDSVFELASISKTFTATAVAILADQGKLGLDDPLSKFIPELPYPGVTLRQMLTHTSGLPDYMQLFKASWPTDRVATNADVIRLLAEKLPPTRFAPGEKWEYSNTGYALLASVIERVSSTSYAAFLKRHLFDPLGMKHTQVLTVLSPNRPRDLALGFIRPSSLSDAHLPITSTPAREVVTMLGGIVGDGAVNASAGDLLRWARALGTHRLVKPETMIQIQAPGRLRDGSLTKASIGAPVPSTYALGWFTRPNGPKVFWHGGGWPGYVTYLERDLDHDRTVVVLDNASHRESAPVFERLSALVRGEPFALPGASIANAVGPIVLAKGAAAGIAHYQELKGTRPEQYRFDEEELNRLGYDLVAAGRLEEAIAIFAFNVELFPQSANAYDSLGEAYLKHGNRALALIHYEKSVKLDPKNQGALDLIQQLRAEGATTGR